MYRSFNQLVQLSYLPGTSTKVKEVNPLLFKKLVRTNSSKPIYINIISWNVQSILSREKLEKFLQTIDDKEINLACICETWFDSNKGTFTSTIRNAGFGIVHSHREAKAGGGTAIIFQNNLPVLPGDASINEFQSFEYCSVFLNPDGTRKILILCVYRLQEVSCDIFCEEMVLILERSIMKSDSLIVLGDFNVWADVENNTKTIKVSTIMNSFGLTQLVYGSTHTGGHTLDHVYANLFEVDIEANIEPFTLGISDHYPIEIKLPLLNYQKVPNTFTFRDIKSIDIPNFKNELVTLLDKINFLDDTSFSNSYESYHISSQDILDKYAPLKSKTAYHRNTTPWIDNEFKVCRSKRRKLERTWRKIKNDINRQNYINQRNICAQLSVTKQQTYYSNLIETSSMNQNSLFNIVNNLLDKTKDISLPSHSEPTELANKFNTFYSDKVLKIRSVIPVVNTKASESNLFSGEPLEHLEVTTLQELKQIINDSCIKTSVDDPLPARLLKSILDDILPFLCILVNKSLTEGSMDSVKQSLIIPLLKKPVLDHELLSNYRPVSNLLFVSKLIERVVLKRLNDHLDKNALQTHSQYGYKKFHNTETMLLGIMNDVLEGFDKNKATIILFLDLSAAFDTIDSNKLLSILLNQIGISGTALSWFKSFLVGRSQRVMIDGKCSNSLDVLFGVPQGSILGPVLFNLYVRSLPNIFASGGFKSGCYADDSHGYKSFSLSFQYTIMTKHIDNIMNHVTNWMNNHFLKINPDKTELLLFYPKLLDHKVTIRGTILTGGQCIRFSDAAKNVGVWLDKHLSMDKHVNHIVSHCYKLLKDISRIRNVLSKNHTEMLVHSVIASRLDYCNSLFFNMDPTNIFKLQKVQNAAARLIARKRKRDSAAEILRSLHWLDVRGRIVFKIILLVYKCINNMCTENLKSMLKFKIHNCRENDFLLLETTSYITKFGKRSFKYAGPRLWNALPLEIRTEPVIDKFKKRIKSILFTDFNGFYKKAFPYN